MTKTPPHLLPTPAVNDMGAGKTPEQWDEWTAKMQEAHGNGNGHGKSLEIEAQRLLPTPNTGESKSGHGRRGGKAGNGRQSGESLDQITHLLPTPVVTDAKASGAPEGQEYRGVSLTDATVRRPHDWGIYAEAIHRWESAFGTPAPAPTQVSPKGNPQLAPAFVEWMMGLPAGHVTSVPGLSRNDMLKALGNGVQPQQAEQAVRHLIAVVFAT